MRIKPILLVIAALYLCACGQKGPLSLPAEPKTTADSPESDLEKGNQQIETDVNPRERRDDA